ncbi:PBP1A family penicillin-binding protein [Ornithinibacillus sp. L9]|uniref:PBP1A family penicillin-binding protein n=1 Tax=Ornithinibacillus caprae TaxID=2678566 RepID=A0A6N8FGV2_9BACI|nr:PBP1A family penicillin-binding protein [Ornithinibacillus caprae]MUK87297.1 PBP1A family penicillin-binding protein [Ornithinibacillus caprae]
MAENSQSRTARRKQRKAKKKPIWKKILLSVLIFVLAIGIGVATLFTYYIVTAPEIDASKLSDPLSSSVLDKDGEVIAKLDGGEKRTKIEYDDLPQVLIDAVTATEDARFFEHAGIDLRRIGGAVIGNLRNGFGSEGASTITQQVVEKSFLTPDKKISIKVQEQWLALKLEREYSKEEIMEMYLNKIFYGSGAYGVAQAAETYFGKTDLNELTLPEAAILAGLPQRPTAYNPFENPDLTKTRMETVLKLMVRHDKISQEEADEALEVDVTSLLREDRPDSTPYEAFLQQVRKEVREKLDGADIYTDGLEIHTTIDTDIQEYVEFLLTDSEENPIKYPDDAFQAGLVVLDTKTGAIRAIGGSRNGTGNDGWNYAIDGDGRQPGSTIKPVVVYGPAIENNKLSTYHQINDDKPYEIGDHSVYNFDGTFHGWVSMRTALAYSYNIPALKTLEETGFDAAAPFSEGLGIPLETRQIGEAIGGTSTQVTPLQLAGAYRAFGNEGIYSDPYAITKVVFADGETREFKSEPEVAMSDFTAFMITDMLKSVVSNGSGTTANVPGLHVAGKTGTTNREDGKAKDSWFSGYTTNYTMTIWTGYPDNSAIEGSKTYAQQLFKHTMTEISKDIETPDFERPDSVVEVAIEKGSNPAKLPSDYTPSSQIVKELFVKGTEPKSTSEKYDQLDPVKDLKATYSTGNDSIMVEWKYDSDEDVSFEISASIDGGQMQTLSTTEEKAIEISELAEGTEYEIQVVAVSNDDDSNRSEARTTKVTVEREDEPDEGNIPSVDGLDAYYDADKNIIDVSWGYNGPPVSFEVFVEPNNQTQTVERNGIEISGVQAGTTYTITITPIGKNGANENVPGESRRVTVEVPAAGAPDDEEDEPVDGDNGGNEDDGDNGGNEDDDEHNDEEDS